MTHGMIYTIRVNVYKHTGTTTITISTVSGASTQPEYHTTMFYRDTSGVSLYMAVTLEIIVRNNESPKSKGDQAG